VACRASVQRLAFAVHRSPSAVIGRSSAQSTLTLRKSRCQTPNEPDYADLPAHGERRTLNVER
jgi:hypothetical protein